MSPVVLVGPAAVDHEELTLADREDLVCRDRQAEAGLEGGVQLLVLLGEYCGAVQGLERQGGAGGVNLRPGIEQEL